MEAGRLLRQQDEVELQPLEPEERVRGEQLPCQRHLGPAGDPHQDNRPIARDAVAPQR
jgi:hypothetical protein